MAGRHRLTGLPRPAGRPRAWCRMWHCPRPPADREGDREAAAQELRRVAQMPGMQDAATLELASWTRMSANVVARVRRRRRCSLRVKNCIQSRVRGWRCLDVCEWWATTLAPPGLSGGGGPTTSPRRTVRQLARCGRIELAGRELVESLSAGTDIWAAMAQEQKGRQRFRPNYRPVRRRHGSANPDHRLGAERLGRLVGGPVSFVERERKFHDF